MGEVFSALLQSFSLLNTSTSFADLASHLHNYHSRFSKELKHSSGYFENPTAQKTLLSFSGEIAVSFQTFLNHFPLKESYMFYAAGYKTEAKNMLPFLLTFWLFLQQQLLLSTIWKSSHPLIISDLACGQP